MKKIAEKFENGQKIDVYESPEPNFGYTVRVTGTKPRKSVEGKLLTSGEMYNLFVGGINSDGYVGVVELVQPFETDGVLKVYHAGGVIVSPKILKISTEGVFTILHTKTLNYYLRATK
jgi:hypothetical protein